MTHRSFWHSLPKEVCEKKDQVDDDEARESHVYCRDVRNFHSWLVEDLLEGLEWIDYQSNRYHCQRLQQKYYCLKSFSISIR